MTINQFQSVTYIRMGSQVTIHYGAFDEVLPEGSQVISGLIERKNEPVFRSLITESDSVTPEQFRHALTKSADTVKKFVETRCLYGRQGGVTSDALWEAYQTFCKVRELPLEYDRNGFIRRFKKVSGVVKRVAILNGKSVNLYDGVVLK